MHVGSAMSQVEPDLYEAGAERQNPMLSQNPKGGSRPTACVGRWRPSADGFQLFVVEPERDAASVRAEKLRLHASWVSYAFPAFPLMLSHTRRWNRSQRIH